MTKKILIIFFFMTYFGIQSLNSQNRETDSLENLLNINSKSDTIKVNLLNETAYRFYQIDVNKTLIYAEEAAELSNKLEYDKGKSESLRLIGIYYLLRGNYSIAMENFQNSLEIAERINNMIQISKAYNNIGLVYGFYEDYAKELEYYKKSIKIDEELGNKRGISISYGNIGLVYINLGNYEQALSYLQKSLELDIELNDKAGIARAYNNIGTVYFDTKDYQKSFEYFNKSLKLSDETGAKSTEAESKLALGKIYTVQDNHPKAYKFIKDAYSTAKEIDELALIIDCSELLAKSCEKLGKYREAYNYHVVFKTMNDSLYNEENTKKIAGIELQYKYEQEKNELELEQKKKDLYREAEEKQLRIIRNFFIGGFILMLLIALYVYFNFLQKRKANLILRAQKKEIEEINNELNMTNEILNNSLETVNIQKKEIENNHNNINASINYAGRIQKALLPPDDFFEENFNSHFILYKPKNIVSGDFYFLKKIEDFLIIAAADCTGHGIPGAFVSMLGIAFLNEIVRKKEIVSSSEVLEELREQVKTTLKDNSNKDGMDIALCVINIKTKRMQYSGANSPLYIIREKELIEIKATQNPIGVHYENEKAFENNEMQLMKEDVVYMFSDGYVDQFGGGNDKKYMFKRFNELLLSIQDEPLKRQKIILNKHIENWKGKNKVQTDDILIIGLKI